MANNWTREQTIVAFNLYCKIPFQKASSTNPYIVEIAKIIGRSPNSVKMKIGNFGSFDPELKRQGIVGLANASKLDKEIWEEFNNNWDELAYQSEMLIASFRNSEVEQSEILPKDIPNGLDKLQVTKIRINQSFFRGAVLSAYNNTCCVTGINLPSLLIASHIKPWNKSDPKTERTNPQNGLCLNALHDKAFDKGLITVDGNYKIILSKELKEHCTKEVFNSYFSIYDNCAIVTPNRFLPNIEFLDYHNQNIFIG